MSENLTQIIKQYATATPSVDAVIEMKRGRLQNAVIRRRLCYGEFDRRIDQYCTKFQKKGIRHGQRVLMMVPPGLEMMCTFFALIRIGAVPILIDTGVGPKEFIRLANFSKPDFIICTRKVSFLIALKLLPISGRTITVYRSFAKHQKPSDVMFPLEDQQTAAILFTSGSTGPAKGVVYQRRHFAAQLSKLRTTYKLVPNGRDVTLLPAFMLFNPMFGRTTVIPSIDYAHPSKLSPAHVTQTIANCCATSSFGAPVLWNKIADYCIEHEIKIRSLERIFLAGMSAPIPTLEKLQKIAPNAKIYTPYGATECLPICSISAEEILEDVRPLQENGAGTCVGKPVEGIEIKIIEPSDAPIETIDKNNTLELGFIGEIVVSGTNVTESYDQLTDETRFAKIIDRDKIWHRMGDLGFLDQRGRLWVVGRRTERVIASDKEEYYPDCIEPLFCKYSKVDRAALIKYATKNRIEPAIVILPKKGEYPYFFWQRWSFTKELRTIAQHFPKTEKITHFFFVKKLPVDPRHNAKIHRSTLSRRFSKI